MTDSRETLVIEPRKVHFDWQDTDLHFIKDEPFVSHYLNGLSILFPEGENWFCRTFAEAMPYLDDNPKLKADAVAFIRQEAMHSRAHQTVIDHYATRGMNAQPAIDEMGRLIKRDMGDAVFGRFIPKTEKGKRRWLIYKLATIAAIEHYTCVMGNWLLEEQTKLDATTHDEKMMDLFKWHCAEEIEHRNVAFDIYNHVSGNNRWLRYVAMVQTIPGLYMALFMCTKYLWDNDPTVTGKFSYWRRWREAAKRGLLPNPVALLKSAGRWFNKKYDTHDEARTQTALDYFAKSDAVNTAQS